MGKTNRQEALNFGQVCRCQGPPHSLKDIQCGVFDTIEAAKPAALQPMSRAAECGQILTNDTLTVSTSVKTCRI